MKIAPHVVFKAGLSDCGFTQHYFTNHYVKVIHKLEGER